MSNDSELLTVSEVSERLCVKASQAARANLVCPVGVSKRHSGEVLDAVVNATIYFASHRSSQPFQESLAKCRLSRRDWSDLSHF